MTGVVCWGHVNGCQPCLARIWPHPCPSSPPSDPLPPAALLPASYTPEQQARFFARLGTAFYDSIVAVWWVMPVCRWPPKS